MIRKRIAWLAIFVLLIGLACNAVTGSGGDAQPPTLPPPQPTQPPPPTSLPPEPTAPPAPTTAPANPTPVRPTDAPEVQGGLQISDQLYVHPQGIFELYPPAGWAMIDEDDGSVLFEAQDLSGAINVQVTNTGYELDGDSFERFVLARDQNFFEFYSEYRRDSVEVDKEIGVATVVKSLLFDGIPQTVVTYYDRHGQTIYTLDFWADEDLFESYADVYDAVFDAVTIDSSAAEDQELYLWIYDFYGPDDLFQIEVPTSWTFESTVGASTIVDTFYSPDEHAVIQNIVYDDGEEISKSVAGAFALELLTQYYAEDIRITDDQVQEDGSERLTWESPGGDYRGITFFETRGTTFLLFTIMYDNPFEDIYFDVLDYTVGTYTVP